MDETVVLLAHHAWDGTIAALGGVLVFLKDRYRDALAGRRQNRAFLLILFAIQVGMAFGVGVMFGDWIPLDMSGRDGMLVAVGLVSHLAIETVSEEYKKRLGV